MFLSFAIIAYILSIVIALVFLFTGKNLNSVWLRIVASFHLIVAVIFIFNLISNSNQNSEETPHYLSFLALICTGVIGCGLVWGVRAPRPFKIYFSVFALSLVLFLISPSTLFRFLLTAQLTNSIEQPLHVKDNIYLERENAGFNSNTQPLYKLTEKRGMFHQALARDLNFKGKLDSIRVISYDAHAAIDIRGYTSKKTYVSDETDSADLAVDLNPKKKDIIERKL